MRPYIIYIDGIDLHFLRLILCVRPTQGSTSQAVGQVDRLRV